MTAAETGFTAAAVYLRGVHTDAFPIHVSCSVLSLPENVILFYFLSLSLSSFHVKIQTSSPVL